MTYKAILSGFPTKEMAENFLDWFEGQGEQCEGIEIFCEATINADVAKGMIHHDDGVEYAVKVYPS